jgi:hypothetical protein
MRARYARRTTSVRAGAAGAPGRSPSGRPPTALTFATAVIRVRRRSARSAGNQVLPADRLWQSDLSQLPDVDAPSVLSMRPEPPCPGGMPIGRSASAAMSTSVGIRPPAPAATSCVTSPSAMPGRSGFSRTSPCSAAPAAQPTRDLRPGIGRLRSSRVLAALDLLSWLDHRNQPLDALTQADLGEGDHIRQLDHCLSPLGQPRRRHLRQILAAPDRRRPCRGFSRRWPGGAGSAGARHRRSGGLRPVSSGCLDDGGRRRRRRIGARPGRRRRRVRSPGGSHRRARR